MAAEKPTDLAAQAGKSPTTGTGALRGVDYDRVAKVATRVRLIDVRLASVHGRREIASENVPADWTDHAFIGFDSVVLEAEPADADRHLRVRCSFLCVFQPGHDPRDGMPSFDEGQPPAVDLEAEFDLTYSLPSREALDQGDLDHFAVANGTHNAWPYWRELAQNFSQRIGVASLVMGPFKMPSSHDP